MNMTRLRKIRLGAVGMIPIGYSRRVTYIATLTWAQLESLLVYRNQSASLQEGQKQCGGECVVNLGKPSRYRAQFGSSSASREYLESRKWRGYWILPLLPLSSPIPQSSTSLFIYIPRLISRPLAYCFCSSPLTDSESGRSLTR
jgi:hypothetical protein